MLWDPPPELAAIVDSAEDAIIGKTIDGTIRSWNRAAEDLYGYSAAEAVGQPITLIIPPERAGEEKEIIARVVTGEKIEHFETERVRRDGSRVPVSLVVSPVRDSSGRVVGASAIARDMTKLKAGEADMRRHHASEHFRKAFADAPVGMALCSVEAETFGRLLEANRALCRMTGYAEHEVLATTFQSLAHHDDREPFLEGAREVATGERRLFDRELQLLPSGGNALWASLTVSLMHDHLGNPLHLLVLVQDITERKRFEGQLEYLADHDAMTGLFNRRRFEQELERQVAYAERYGSQTAVVVLDIDDFKYVNDTLGHKTGDEVIAAAARVLRGRLRATDLVGRLGGDEFAAVLPETGGAKAQGLVNTLLQGIREEVRHVLGDERRLTASAGIALVSRTAKVTAEELLVAADIAMYDAKQAGGDRLALYSDELQDRTRARQSWLERIRHALEADDFILYAQPILDLREGRISGQELLIRMRGEGGDVIPPGSFLPIAERFGLIEAIDRWVVSKAIGILGEQPRAGREPSLAVNVSGRSVTDPRLPILVEEGVADGRFDPANLTFEITETAAIENILHARRFAERMRGLGCRFALDDFGAGFGSFYYLKHLPCDYLKIDGEFIRKLLTHPTDQLVVRSIVDIARGLGKQTIAEFVGDADTIRLLRAYGVDHAQGFEIGRPRPVRELPSAVAQGARA